MIGYVTIGVKEMARAAAFYDALLGEVGAKRTMDTDRFIAWSNGPGPALSICTPADEKPATVGNGVMIAIAADSREQVDTIYKRAIELGASDEGPPGPRGDGFYAGYFRDLDGNKLNAFVFG